MSVRLVVTVLVTATAVLAGPPGGVEGGGGAHQCAAFCKKETNKFKYVPGTTYEYDYNAEVTSQVVGADSQQSTMHLAARALVHAVSQCDMTLQVLDVRLSDAKGELAHSLDLEKHTLHFAFQDGAVEELCPAEGETTRALNIKRGILSTFQNDMRDFRVDNTVHETDVSGTCETHYSLPAIEDGVLRILKRKNLEACSHRMAHFLSLQSLSYSNAGSQHSLPLIRSSHDCEQTISQDGLLTDAVCTEHHLFKPFSNGESGAKTDVRTQLKFVRALADGKPGTPSLMTRRTTLLLDHEATGESGDKIPASSNIVNEVTSLLNEMVHLTSDGVQAKAPVVFARLVAAVRHLALPHLESLLAESEGSTRNRRFLLDAMSLAGTADSMAAMVLLWKNGWVSDAEMDSWTRSLAFQKEPTPHMLVSVAPLLEGVPREAALLGVSSLVHGVCQNLPPIPGEVIAGPAGEPMDCAKVPVVADTLRRIERLLGPSCRPFSREATDQALLALRALGNAGSVTSNDVLKTCYNESANPAELRVGAISALRRIPCAFQRNTEVLKIYSNTSEDVEVRIAAYLAVMQCPSLTALRVVKDRLYSEEVNQVASFVWTHLTNLQETASPWKQRLRELIETDFLRNKFKTDARKFSRNYEGSHFFGSVNVGGTVESNVVFSPQSYLPRSATLNLTVDLFGESVNLFELGARAEGLEPLVESLFAPSGLLADDGVRKILKNARSGGPDADTENSLHELSTAFDARGRARTEPTAAVFARIFGNELHYSRFHGLRQMLNSAENFASPMQLLSSLLRTPSVDVSRSFLFVDAAYSLPTIAGMPLAVRANGTATVGLTVRGRIDLSGLLSRRAAHVEGRIAPSAALQVSASMRVSAGPNAVAGIRTIATMHSNTLVDGKIVVDGGKLVSIEVNVPRDRMDVLQVESHLFVEKRGVSEELRGIEKDREQVQGCTSDMAATITGLKLCSLLEYANASRVDEAPYFPLTGPFKYNLQVLKTDMFDTYTLTYQRENDERGRSSWSIALDTPGSRVYRRLSSLLQLDTARPERPYAAARFTSPLMSLAAEATALLTPERQELNTTVTVDRREFLSLQARWQLNSISGTPPAGHAKTSLSIAYRQRPWLDVAGVVTYIANSKYIANLQITGATREPVQVSLNVVQSDSKWELSSEVESSVIRADVRGSLRTKLPNYVSSKLTASYTVRNGKPQTFDVAAKYDNQMRGALVRRSASFNAQSSEWPQYNVVGNVDIQRSDHYWESSEKLGLGETTWSASQLYRNRWPNDYADVALRLTLECPRKNVDYRFDVQHKTAESAIASHILIQYDEFVRWQIQVKASQGPTSDSSMSYNGGLVLRWPWRQAYIQGTVVEVAPGRFDVNADSKWIVYRVKNKPQSHGIRVTGTYSNNSTAISANHDLKLDMRFPLEKDDSGRYWAVPVNITGAIVATNGRSHQWLLVERAGQIYKLHVDYTKSRYHTLDALLRLDTKYYKGRLAVLHEANEKGLIVDLQFTKRVVFDTKITFEAAKSTVSVELYWDKDVDPSKRVALHAEADSESKQAELALPDQFVKLNVIKLESGFSAQLQWSDSDPIELQAVWSVEVDSPTGFVTVRLSTPFPGYELQTISCSYALHDPAKEARVGLTWRDQVLDAELKASTTPDDWSTTIGVTSSLDFLRSLTLSLFHSDKVADGRKMQSRLILNYDESVTEAYAKLDVSTNSIAAVATFSSPLDLLPKLYANLSVQTSEAGEKGHLEVSWAPDKKAGVMFELEMSPKSRGSIFVQTPFQGYEWTSLESLYFTEQKQVVFDVKGAFHRHSAHFALSGQQTADLLVGSALLDTTFSKNISVTAKHSTKRARIVELLDVAYGPTNILFLDIDGKLVLPTDVEISSKLHVMHHHLSAKLANKVVGTSFVTTANGSWNEDNIALNMRGSFSQAANITAVSYKLSIDGSSMPSELSVAFDHKHIPAQMQLNTLSLPGGLSIDHSFTFEGAQSWINKITVTTASKSGVIRNVHSVSENQRDVVHTMSAELNGRNSTAIVSYGTDSSGLVDKVATSILTPWTDPLELKAGIPTVSANKYAPHLSLLYKKNKRISLSSTLMTSSSPEIEMKFLSPFCEPVMIRGRLDTSVKPKTADIAVSWEGKTVKIQAESDFSKSKTYLKIHASRENDVNLFESHIGYDFASRDKNIIVKVRTDDANDWHVKLNAVVESGKYQSKFSYRLPIPEWEAMSIQGDVDLTKRTKVGVVSYTKNNESLTLSSSAVIEPMSPYLSISIDSKIPGIDTATFLAGYDRTQKNINVRIQYSRRNTWTELIGNLETGEMSGVAHLNVSTPIQGYEKMFADFKYNFEGTEQTVLMSARKNDWHVEFDGNSSAMDTGSGEAMIRLRLPYKGMEMMQAQLKQETDDERRSVRVILTNNENTICLTGNVLTPGEGGVSISATLNTPFHDFETITGFLNVTSPLLQRKSAIVTLYRNAYKFEALGDMNVGRLEGDGKLKITSPLDSYPGFTTEFKYDIKSQRKIAFLVYAVGDEENKIDLAVDSDGLRKGTGNLNINLPILKMTAIKADGRYDYATDVKVTDVVVRSEKGDKIFMSKVSVHDNEMEVVIATPAEGYNNLTFLATIGSGPKNKTATVHFSRDETVYSLTTELSYAVNTANVSVKLETPYEGWEAYNLNGFYDTRQALKKAHFSVSNTESNIFKVSAEASMNSKFGNGQVAFDTVILNPSNQIYRGSYDFRNEYSAEVSQEADGVRKTLAGKVHVDTDVASVRVKTPYDGFEDVELSGTLSRGAETAVGLSLDRNGVKDTMEVSFSLQGNAFRLNVKTPFEDYESVNAVLDYGGLLTSGNEYTASFVATNSDRNLLTVRGNITLDWENAVSLDGHLSSPLLPGIWSDVSLATIFAPGIPPKALLFSLKNGDTQIFYFKSEVYALINNGFTAAFTVENLNSQLSRMKIEFYPKDIILKAGLKTGPGLSVEYSAEFEFDPARNLLNAECKSPAEKYEHIGLGWHHGNNFVKTWLRTPIEGLEEIRFQGSGDVTSKGQYSFKVAANRNNQSFVGDFGTRYGESLFDSHLLIKTPFNAYQKLFLAVGGNLSHSKKSGLLQFEKNADVYKASFEASVKYLIANVVVHAETPYEGYRKARIEASYDLNTVGSKRAIIVGDFDEVRKVNSRFAFSYGKSRFDIDVGSDWPYFFATLSAGKEFDHAANREQWTVKTGVKLVGIEVHISAVSANLAQNREGQLAVDSNIRGNKNKVKLAWHLDNGPKHKKAAFTVDMGQGKKIQAIASMFLDGFKNVETEITFVSLSAQTYSLTTEWNVARSNVIAGSVGLQWGVNKEIKLSGHLEIADSKNPVDMDLKLTSPFKGLENVSFRSKVTYDSDLIISSVLQWDNSRSITLSGGFSHSALQTNAQVEFSTPFTDPLSFAFYQDHLGLITTLFQLGDKRYELKGNMEYHSTRHMGADFTLTTPKEGLSLVRVKGQFNLDSAEKLASASFTKEMQTAGVHLSFKVVDRQYSTKMSLSSLDGQQWLVTGMLDRSAGLAADWLVSWDPKEKIEGSVNILLPTIKLECHTPFTGYEYTSLNAELQSGDIKNECSVLARWSGQMLNASAVMDYSTEGQLNFQLGLASPFNQPFHIEGVYKHNEGHHVLMSIKHNEKVSKIEGKLQAQRRENQVTFHFESSKDDYKGVEIKGAYTFNRAGTNREAHLTAKIGGMTAQAEAEAAYSDNSIQGKILFTSSLKAYKILEASAELRRTQPKTAFGNLSFKKNDDVYQVRGTCSYLPGNIRARFNVDTPTSHIGDVFFIARYEINSLNLVIGTETRKFEVDGVYQLDGPVYSVNATLKSPYLKALKHLAVRTVVDSKDLRLYAVGQWKTTKKVVAEASVKANGVLVRLETPFTDWETVELSGEYARNSLAAYNVPVYDLESKALWGDLEVVLRGSLKSDPSDFGLNGVVKWNEGKSIDLNATVKVTGGDNLGNVQCKFRLKSPFVQMDRMEMDLELDMETKGKLTSVLTLVTPFDVLPELKSSLILRNDDYKVMSGRIEATALGREMAVAAEISNDDLENVRLKLDMVIPFLEIPPVTIEGHMNQKEWLSVDTAMKVVLPRTTYLVTGNYQLTKTTLDAKFLMDTPIIKTDLAFGGLLEYKDMLDLKAEAYFGEHNGSFAYLITNSYAKTCASLVAPSLKLKEGSVDVFVKFDPVPEGVFSYKLNSNAGSVRAGLEQKNTIKDGIAVAARMEIDLPQLLSGEKRFLKFDLDFDRQVATVTVTASYSHYEKHEVSVTIENGPALFFTAYVKNGVLGKKDVSFKLSRKWETLDLNVANVFIAKKQERNGFVVLKYRGKEHRVQYELGRAASLEGKVEVESPIIAESKASLYANVINVKNNLFAEVNCTVGSRNHRGTVNVTISDDGSQDSLRIEISRHDSWTKVIEAVTSLKGDVISGQLTVKHTTSEEGALPPHVLTIRHKKGFPLDTHFHLVSDYIPGEVLTASLVTGDYSMNAFIEDKFGKTLILEASVDKKEGEASFRFVPNLDIMKSLYLAGVFNLKGYESSKLALNVDLQSSQYPIMLAGFFNLSQNAVHSSLNLSSTFYGYEKLQAAFRLPLQLSYNMEAFGSATLPTGNHYSVHCKYRNLDDLFEIGLGAQYETKKLGTDFKIVYGPIYSLEGELNTPFDPYLHYRVDLKGQKALSDGNEIVNYVEWNDERVELRYSMMAEPNKVQTYVQLSTPFVDYEKYGLSIRLENRERKVLAIKMSHPQLKHDLSIEVDYVFNGMSDVSFTGSINAAVHPAFESASVLFGNRLNTTSRNYKGLLFARYNNEEISFTAEGDLKPGAVMSEIHANLNGKEMYFQGKGGMTNDLIEVSVQLETPFAAIQNAEIFLRSARKWFMSTEARIVFNNEEYAGISLRKSEDGTITFEVRNSWRPVSLSYAFSIDPDITLFGDVCWNMNDKDANTIRAILSLVRSQDKQDLDIVFKVPTRVITIGAVRHREGQKHAYDVRFSLEKDETCGLRLVLDNSDSGDEKYYRLVTQLRLPRRTLELSRTAVIEPSEGNQFKLKIYGSEFLWDADKDRSKKLSLYVNRHEQEIRVYHAAFERDIVVRCAHTPNIFRVELEYSAKSEDKLVVEGFYNDTRGEVNQVEMSFSIRHEASGIDLRAQVLGDHDGEKTTGRLNINYLDSSTGQNRRLEAYGKVSHVQSALETAVLTNENRIAFKAALWSKGNNYRGITAALQMNQKEPLTVQARFNADDAEEPSLNLDVKYGDSRDYNLFAGMPNHREIKAHARHTIYGAETVDALFTMRLNTSTLFWLRASWRPEIVQDLQDGVLREYSDMVYSVKAIYEGFTAFLQEDLEEKWGRMYPRFSDALTNLAEYNIREKHAIAADMPNVVEKLKGHFERNDFYVKDVWKYISSLASSAGQGASCVGEGLKEMLDTVIKSIQGFASSLAEILTVDLSQTLDFVPSIQILSSRALVHWNASLVDVAAARNATRTWTRAALSAAQTSLHQLEEHVSAQLVAWERYVETVCRRIERAVVPMLIAAKDLWEVVAHRMRYVQRAVTEFVEAVQRHVLSVEEAREMIALYNAYASWLEELHLQDILDNCLIEISRVSDWVLEDLRRTYAEYKEYWLALYKAAFGHYEALSQLPPVVSIRNVTNALYQKAEWAWRYYQVSQQARKAIALAIRLLEKAVMQLLQEADSVSLSSTAAGDVPGSLVVFDTGLLEYSQVLPVHWHGFDRLPEFRELSPYYTTSEQTADVSALDKYRYYLLDAMNAYKKGLKPWSLLPPYGATALLLGNEHYVTFDGRVYDFVGECSYVLAADFLRHKFTVIVNYEYKDRSSTKKSITVISNGQKIDLNFVTERVLVDGKKVETPIQVGSETTVERAGDRVIIRSSHGLEVDCSFRQNICAFDIAGWHFGRTAGLLGTYDNEKSNDLLPPGYDVSSPMAQSLANSTAPPAQVAAAIGQFAHSWRVGRKECRPLNHAPLPPPVDPLSPALSLVAEELCQSYFLDSSSPLAPCFPRVDPAPFQLLCSAAVGSKMNSAEPEMALCPAAAGYVQLCRRAGMELWVPDPCVRCRLPEGKVLGVGEVKVFHDDAPKSSDVVFILERGTCLENAALEELPNRLDAALRAQGLTANRFAVVTYGGADVFSDKPHIRTVDGDTWASRRAAHKAFQGVKLSGEAVSMSGVYEAIWTAARLPFRAGVSKLLVQVRCGSCQDPADQSDQLSDTLSLLLDADMTFHIMAPRAVAMKRASSKANRIFGADSEGVFTARNVKSLQPNIGMLKQVNVAKDLCSPLALQTNGTVFNLDRLPHPSYVASAQTGPSVPTYNKKFVDVWARRVASRAQPASCQRCDCVADAAGDGQTICQRCTSPDVEAFVKEWENMSVDEYEEAEVELDLPDYSAEEVEGDLLK